jgi:SAM-dependent methyltransferase
VVALGELTDADRRVCLASLFTVLAETLGTETVAPATVPDRELWNAYLSAFWLRPETALILYAEAIAIRNAVKTRSGNWLDLGCGDGVHAALYSGWRFDPAFDVFQSLDLAAADIYHHWNADDFTATAATHGTKIDFGIDIKPTAIQRAAALNVFSNVQQADATRLPLPDRSVKIVFSNMLRDLGDPLPAALAECQRVLSDDGLLLISAMTPAYSQHLHFAPAARQAEAAGESQRAKTLLRLDRGRSVFCQQQLSVSQWRSLLSERGLAVKSVHPIVGPAIIRFWDIGLRPFSIQLLKQRESWKNSGALPQIKPAMLQLLSAALEPLLQNLTAGEPCMNLIVAGKA